jgi:predicted PurR-regulated permease PerM
MLQFSTAGPFLIIVLSVIPLHLLSANLLIPKFIGSRLDIAPVAATVGMFVLELAVRERSDRCWPCR